MRLDFRKLLTPWTALGSLGVAGILLAITLLVIGWTTPRVSPEVGFAPADVTLIPPPTRTPDVTPTSTVDPQATPAQLADGIAVGSFVQIAGTEGAGLRIRRAPGLDSETAFRGEESEVFSVLDGPRDADGHTWWYVAAQYDESRAGWAAADWLIVIPSP
jgi:hypothetical protein